MLIAEAVVNIIPIVVGLVVVLALVAVAVRCIRRSSKPWLAAIALGGLGVIGFLSVMWMESREAHLHLQRARAQAMLNVLEVELKQSEHQQRQIEEQRQQYLRERAKTVGDVLPLTERTPTEVSRPGVAWMPEVDEQFEADIFPSKQYAVRYLMRLVIPEFKEVLSDEAEPQVIEVTSGAEVSSPDLQSMFETAVSHLREEFPDAQVLFDPSDHRAVVPDPPRVEGGVALQLTLGNNVAMVRGQMVNDSVEPLQTLQATLKGVSGDTFATSVMILDKPWVDQFDQFWSRRDGRYLVARSDTFADSAEAAHEQAMQKAVQILTPPVRQAINQVERQRGFVPSGEGDVRDAVRLHLENGNLFGTDRFSQRLRAPYGVLWREAILFRIDSGAMHVVIEQIAGESLIEHRAQLSQLFGFCVLLLVIVILYVLLNWATKGYYRTTIGLVMGLVGAAGSAMILLAVAL